MFGALVTDPATVKFAAVVAGDCPGAMGRASMRAAIMCCFGLLGVDGGAKRQWHAA